MIHFGKKDFAEFVFAHERPVFVYIRRIVRDHHVAEDLLQETFLRAYRFLEKGGVPCNPRSWLLRIAKHLAIDHRRRHADAAAADIALIEEFVAVEKPMLEPEMVFMRGRLVPKREIASQLSRALETLPKKHRRLLNTHYQYTQSYEQTAIRNGMSIDTAKVSLYRSRKKIRSFVLTRVLHPQIFCSKEKEKER